MIPSRAPLPSDCASRPTDATVAATPRATIGEFRCPVDHPAFADSGPIARHLVVFPRTSVWIRHEGSTPFLADPLVVTIYNRAQRYRRYPAAAEGDRCDWFGVSDEVAREIVAAFDERDADGARPFRHEWARSTAALYLRQRLLLRRARRGDADALELEEGVIAIVAAVLALAYGAKPRTLARRADARHRALADDARAMLARRVEANQSVSALAAALGTSPFHLCRVFKAIVGITMNEYRNELRIRAALARLEGGGHASLSSVAHDLGYSSHSHFVRAARARLGLTPGAVRSLLV